MTEMFLKIFNLSITAGWIVVTLLLLRPLLKKAPRWIFCLLWAVVALRLVLPFSFESELSLIPSPEVLPQDFIQSQTPAIHSGIPAVNSAINPLFTSFAPAAASWWENLLEIAATLWATGVLLMFLYSLIAWIRLRWQVRVSIHYQKNIYSCDDIDSPFILGILRPRIYIPSGLSPEYLTYVLAHEAVHLRRRDHWWKPLGFGLLAVYWFNPLFWIAYILLCKDIEQSCDERVIQNLDALGKKAYSRALLACSAHRRMVMACPVAFGEVSVKTRIQNVLGYQKPRFWIIAGSVLLCVLSAVCFLTNPLPCDHTYTAETTLVATCVHRGVDTMTCDSCHHSYTTYTTKLEHSYDGGTVTVQPTCTSKGTCIYTCTGCGRERRQPLSKLEHIPGEAVLLQAPTCASTGKTETRCILCQQVCATMILSAAQEHILVEEVLRESTCARNGEGIRKCQLCDYTETLGYPKLEHRYKEVGWSMATCANVGTISSVCLDCDHVHIEFLPRNPDAHHWVSGYCIHCSSYSSERDPIYQALKKYNENYSLLDSVTGNSCTGTVQLPVIQIYPDPSPKVEYPRP